MELFFGAKMLNTIPPPASSPALYQDVICVMDENGDILSASPAVSHHQMPASTSNDDDELPPPLEPVPEDEMAHPSSIAPMTTTVTTAHSTQGLTQSHLGMSLGIDYTRYVVYTHRTQGGPGPFIIPLNT